jgi:hypothetical protein
LFIDQQVKEMFLYVVLASFLLFVSIQGKGNSAVRRDRAWKAKKAECEENSCSHLIVEESYNCVYKCTSPNCFEQIYSDSPLEDGEIDYDRERDYISCLRKEQQDIQRQRRNIVLDE